MLTTDMPLVTTSPHAKLTHVLESQQFSRQFLEEEFFPLTKQMEKVVQNRSGTVLKGKRVDILFYEPSTRTRNSFEKAVSLLGGEIFSTENAKDFSSAAKGESIEDTIRILTSYYTDAIVIRHHEEGGVARAAAISNVPILNAGDGTGQHPTQALLDLYTIYEKHGAIDGLQIAMVGDLLHGRTVRSLAYLLAKFKKVRIDFVSPPQFGMRQDILEYLDKHGIKYTIHQNLTKVLPKADVVYMTRPQKERFAEGLKFDPSEFILDLKKLSKMPKKSIVMHPLPRNDELPKEVDEDSRVVIFREAQNGLFVRMALFTMIFG